MTYTTPIIVLISFSPRALHHMLSACVVSRPGLLAAATCILVHSHRCTTGGVTRALYNVACRTRCAPSLCGRYLHVGSRLWIKMPSYILGIYCRNYVKQQQPGEYISLMHLGVVKYDY